jgi:hypothetical protein
MVATFVEIVAGVRLSDKKACEILLGMDDEEYDQKAKEINAVFIDSDVGESAVEYSVDFPLGVEVFKCICCSDTTDVIVGMSLRKLYRVKTNCENCKGHTLCNDCFNTTEQGLIDYDKTYSFKEGVCVAKDICDRCYSYNKDSQDNINCKTCKYELTPCDLTWTTRQLQKLLNVKTSAHLYFHWNDCCSCT